MLVLVGLGNPEAKYKLNRHNVGFMTIDSIVANYKLAPYKTKFQSQIITKKINDTPVIFSKPQTFMNLSGKSIGNILNFYKLKCENVIVIHDDLDLNLGTVKTKIGGSSGGHNGLKSLDSIIGKNYRRLRIGIGHPGDKTLVNNYVLGDFSKSENVIINILIKNISLNFDKIITKKEDNLSQLLAENISYKEKNGI
ncbi:aminoacyl-tRNA hydrolase [Alphaproteobacteria bacterium]|jgi:PTH1 family peptidyl-tRNA hydrolase|nr:aminoacyl-tRNA hydrolase [Alphaproteobacteria bacterium]